MSKTTIITGVTGQMGSYFSEFLLAKGFKVIGTVRRLSVSNHKNIDAIKNNPNFILEPMDLGDVNSVNNLIEKYRPDYFINCAANSFVGSSWDYPEQHLDFNTLGVLRQLEAIKRFSPHTRYVNFGSSEEFGDVLYSPQDENHPPRARSPYSVSKIAARQIIKVYRESFNLYALQCWCFNYESERRGFEFLTRKVTQGVARIKKAIENNELFEPIELGNLDSKRDWSHALDIVEGVWRILNQEQYNDELLKKFSGYPYYMTKEPRRGAERHLSIAQDIKNLSKEIKEYVFASDETHTVREFVEKSFEYSGIKEVWRNKYNIMGKVSFSWGKFYTEKDALVMTADEYTDTHSLLVKINPKFYRPSEVELLLGNSSLARKELGWKPQIGFDELVKRMTLNDINLNKLNQN